MNKTTNTVTKLKGRRALNAKILAFPVGESVIGVFQGVQKLMDDAGNPVLSKNYGNELYTLTLLQDGVPMTYWADGGIRGAIKLGRVAVGQSIEVLNTGETEEIENGRVNVYEIYDAGENH